MKKRILSALLVLVMLLSVMPMSALAAEVEQYTLTYDKNVVLASEDAVVNVEMTLVTKQEYAGKYADIIFWWGSQNQYVVTPRTLLDETGAAELVIPVSKAVTDAACVVWLHETETDEADFAWGYAGGEAFVFDVLAPEPTEAELEGLLDDLVTVECTDCGSAKTYGYLSGAVSVGAVATDDSCQVVLSGAAYAAAYNAEVEGQHLWSGSDAVVDLIYTEQGGWQLEKGTEASAVIFWVSEEEEELPPAAEGPDAPDAAVLTDLLEALVTVECVDCGTARTFGYLPGSVTVGEVTENGTCVIEVSGSAYAAAYNAATDSKHNWDGDNKRIELVYNEEKGEWQLPKDGADVAWTFWVSELEVPEIFVIRATEGKYGDISPEGSVRVKEGDSKTFRFYPDKGYEVSAIYIDGVKLAPTGYLCDYWYNWKDCYWYDCGWIEWSHWYEDWDGWCCHDHKSGCHAYDCAYDWSEGFTFYNVTGSHTIHVEFGKIVEDCPSAAYWDLDTGAWYHEATDYVLENGLMIGTGGAYFDPNGATTRGQLVTILYRLAGAPKVSSSSAFADVADNQWYTKAVNWAAGKGIVEGYGDGTFGVNDVVTREQTVAILYRYAKIMGCKVSDLAELSKFLDAELVSDYAKIPFGWAVEEDVIEGEPTAAGNKLDPKGSTARVEMAAMLMRYVEYVG